MPWSLLYFSETHQGLQGTASNIILLNGIDTIQVIFIVYLCWQEKCRLMSRTFFLAKSLILLSYLPYILSKTFDMIVIYPIVQSVTRYEGHNSLRVFSLHSVVTTCQGGSTFDNTRRVQILQ